MSEKSESFEVVPGLNPTPAGNHELPEAWTSLRKARVEAAHAINENVLCIPEQISGVRSAYETHHSNNQLPPERNAVSIAQGLRNTLITFAGHRSQMEIWPLLRQEIGETNACDPQLLAREIERLRTEGQDYYADPGRVLLGDESVLRRIIVEIVEPVVAGAFTKLTSSEQIVFADAFAQLTQELRDAGRAWLFAKHPEAAYDFEFLANPRKYKDRYSKGAWRLAFPFSGEPETPFVGPFIGAGELVSPILTDAWRALDMAECPPQLRARILHKHLSLLSLPAAMHNDSSDKMLFWRRHEPGRKNPFLATYVPNEDTWVLGADHPILKSAALNMRPGVCGAFDSISKDGVSAVNTMMALGITIIGKPTGVNWFE